MEIILARHGNTFGPGDKVVMAGLTNDLPLVARGGEQAVEVAKALKANNIKPDVVCCAQLRRTKRFAEVVMENLLMPGEPIVDSRLNELDYGDWTGLSDEEIKEKFGADVVEDWQQKSRWPKGANWQPTPRKVIKEVKSFVKELENFAGKDGTALVVSSNGRLRYFLKLVGFLGTGFNKAVKEQNFKVKTGHLCKLVEKRPGKFEVAYWNVSPQDVIENNIKL